MILQTLENLVMILQTFIDYDFEALQLWYQSHALAESVGPTREDACARKGGGL